MQVKNNEKLYRISDYAKAYQISRPTIYKMIERGELKVKIIGGVKFIVAPIQ